MIVTSKESASDREMLLVGPYGVLGTGVIDSIAANPAWRVTTAARRPAPTYRTQTPPRHVSVDLMDREGRSRLSRIWILSPTWFMPPTLRSRLCPKP
jgi:hypothetical protein